MRNGVTNVNAKRTYASGDHLNETLFNFSNAKWNPSPEDDGTVGRNYQGVGRLGGRDTYQKFVQDRYSLRNDFTGLASAARMVCPATVKKATAAAATPANRKVYHSISMRYAKSANHWSIAQ